MRTVIRLAIVAAGAIACSSPTFAEDAPPPKPRPIGNPGTWIPAGAYPPGARASAEEGRVGFTLDIDESGRAMACKVTLSSGSPLLDDTTCALMEANARFDPPRDKRNKPVASKWSSSVMWRLETTPPEAQAGPATPPPAVPAPATVKSAPPTPGAAK